MQWSDVTKAPTSRILRQFAGLCLVVFVGLAAWRAWQGSLDTVTRALAVFGVVVGIVGLIRPMAIRWVFTAWMIAAFPIGWAVSRVALAIVYYLLFTPVAIVFRLMQRDVLQRRRRPQTSYWTDKPVATDAREYLRQF